MHLMVAVPETASKEVSEAVDVVDRAYRGDVREGIAF